jgi:hypothetical protein
MQTKSTVVSMYTPSRILVPRDPPEVQNSVRVVKSIQLPFTVATTPTAVTVSALSGALPGGLTYWNKIRFQSIKIWSNEVITGSGSGQQFQFPILIVTTTPVGTAEPAIQWNDQGTTGQQRPAIGFSFGLAVQSQWFGVADIQQLFTIALHAPDSTPVGGSVRIQAVVEILSPIL